METWIFDAVFVACSVGAIVLALLVMVVRNPVYGTFFLVGSFVPLAVLYFALFAPFIGIIQILVYAGAIMVLFTFVIMMVHFNKNEYRKERSKPYQIVSSVLVLLFLGVMALSILYPTLQGAPYPYTFTQKTEATVSDDQLQENFGSISNLGYLIFNGTDFDRYKMASVNTSIKDIEEQIRSTTEGEANHASIASLEHKKAELVREKERMVSAVSVANNPFLLSFEIISLLILVGIVGVLVLGRKKIDLA